MTLLLAAALIATYDCQAAPPSMIGFDDKGQPSAGTLGLPPELDKWSFSLAIESGNPLQTTVTWPGNPLQSIGKYPTMPAGEGAYVFTTYSAGPCLLTEKGCMAQFTLIDQGDGTAVVAITPAAIATVEGKRKPMLVVLQGQCKRTGGGG